jgi:hypothetical protein
VLPDKSGVPILGRIHFPGGVKMRAAFQTGDGAFRTGNIAIELEPHYG